jgi:putative sterol carrier protein
MSDENLRDQINELIHDEIQEGINEYLEQTESPASEGFGITKHGKDEKLKVNISNDEVDRLIKEYKKIKKRQKSNLNQVKLLDRHGNFLK